MPFLALTNNERILETQNFYCDTSARLKPRMTHKVVSGVVNQSLLLSK